MTNSIDTKIGSRIRLRRRELGLTQQRLADLIGISIEDLQWYEAGHARVDVELLLAFKRTLGVELSYFYQDGATLNGSLSIDKI